MVHLRHLRISEGGIAFEVERVIEGRLPLLTNFGSALRYCLLNPLYFSIVFHRPHILKFEWLISVDFHVQFLLTFLHHLKKLIDWRLHRLIFHRSLFL
jgi:hypothetical protein